MRETIVVSKEEFSLPVVSFFNIRYLKSKLLQTLPCFMQVGRRPVKVYAMIVFRPDRCARPLVKPKVYMFVMDHAAHKPAFASHLLVSSKAEPIYPKAQAFFDVSAGDNGYA
jgi:hypothetical protein